jgi:class 3 adenylate cyclase
MSVSSRAGRATSAYNFRSRGDWKPVATLDTKARSQLRDSAFAYIDSSGRRRLPINDAPHVRNALARFDQTVFENDAARERARRRLLKAAKVYGITPIGFFDEQLRKARRQGEIKAQAADVASLPKGTVTFLFTDMERSTRLLRRLGDAYAPLLRDVRAVIRTNVLRVGGREIDARADEFFAVFQRPARALAAALAIQRGLHKRSWPDGLDVRVRMGLHTGRPTIGDAGYVGIAVNTVARVCAAAHGGQILVSSAARHAMDGVRTKDLAFQPLGRYFLAGLPGPDALYQVEAIGLITTFPRPRARAASEPSPRGQPVR